MLAILKKALADIAQLKRPVTAAAVLALVVELVPGLHVNGTAVAGVLMGVGVVAAFVEAQLTQLGTVTAPLAVKAEDPGDPPTV